MTEIPELLKMLKAGVHFGHRESKWHPKMAPFIFTSRGGVHIIDLEKTVESLKSALDLLRDVVAKGGTVLFVGTKKQAAPILEKYAKEVGMPYVSVRWLGGTLTNFKVIIGLVKKLQQYEEQESADDYEKKYTKKERHDFSVDKERLETMVGGLRGLEKLPDVVYIIDVKAEKTAVREAKRKGITTVAVCDTNVDPSDISYPIPANDDATKSIEMITGLVAEAVREGIASREQKGDKDDAKKVNES